jgi:Cys-tRNA(Pro)/Cys-tRNA(Cys) deacylase
MSPEVPESAPDPADMAGGAGGETGRSEEAIVVPEAVPGAGPDAVPNAAPLVTPAATDGATRAAAALRASRIEHTITRHGRVSSLAEAAAARGVEPRDIIKTLVVRRADDDFLFVLVPGDREISWPKLRAHLGVSRLSMPDATTARDVTGYERGTITPFGSIRAWPVIADATIPGRAVSIGAGAHGVAATAYGDDVVQALAAEVADVTEPAAG